MWGADMPAYIRHHEVEPPFMICPNCVGLTMTVKDVAPRWNVSEIDFTYECSDCSSEIRHTLTRQELC